MPKRVQVTSSHLRQGVGPVVTYLLQGYEVVLLHHGSPVGVIRRWTEADGDGLQLAPKSGGPEKKEGGKSEPWPGVSGTGALKPTFSGP